MGGTESSHSWIPPQDQPSDRASHLSLQTRGFVLAVSASHRPPPRPGDGPVANMTGTRCDSCRRMLLAEWGPSQEGTHPSLQERYLLDTRGFPGTGLSYRMWSLSLRSLH